MTVFGARGPASRCYCQRYKLRPGEAFAKFPAEERAFRLRQQCSGEETAGLIAYLDGEPVGWCAVEPRTSYEGLLRNNRVPWEGRDEDKADDSVWAVDLPLRPRRVTGAGASATRSPAPPSTTPASAAPARSRATR